MTPGWFDLRPIVDRMPWPDVRGKRCLDVGTYDGFLAFELERRGASEVVATDISDHTQWDWSWRARQKGPEFLAAVAGPEKGMGFRIAKDALGSSVEKVEINIYDLSPERVGEFDVVVCGSLMLHLKNPIRALEAIRSVAKDQFLSSEQIDPWMTLRARRRPAAWVRAGDETQWFVPNVAGHRAMVEAAGFKVERTVKPYAIAYGSAHPPGGSKMRRRADRLAGRIVTRAEGVPHVAVLARAVAG